MIVLSEADNNRSLEILKGDLVRIDLKENATTGYRWAVDHYDDHHISLIEAEPHYTSDVIGAGGYVSFVFRGKMVGRGKVVLKHWRHWEGDLSTIRRLRFQFIVREER